MADSIRQNDDGTAYGRYQGAHWRRVCRSVIGLVVLLVVGLSWIRHVPTLEQLLAGIMVIVVVLALCDWLFARRTGIEIELDGLVIRGPIRSIHVPWSQVQGFQWGEVRSLTKTEYLYVETNQAIPRRVPKDAPIRLPTISRMTKPSSLPNDRFLGPLFTSPNIRSKTGEEVDAIATLERAQQIAAELNRHLEPEHDQPLRDGEPGVEH
jgi:hypothetical protein